MEASNMHIETETVPSIPLPRGQATAEDFRREESTCKESINKQKKDRVKAWEEWVGEWKKHLKSGDNGWYIMSHADLALLEQMAQRLPPEVRQNFLTIFTDKHHFYMGQEQGERLRGMIQASPRLRDPRFVDMIKKSMMLSMQGRDVDRIKVDVSDPPSEELKASFARVIGGSFNYMVAKESLQTLLTAIAPEEDALRAELTSISQNMFDIKMESDKRRQLINSIRTAASSQLPEFERVIREYRWVYFSQGDKERAVRMINSIVIDQDPWFMPEMAYMLAIGRSAARMMNIEPTANGQSH